MRLKNSLGDVYNPIVLTCPMDALLEVGFNTSTLAHRCRRGRPHQTAHGKDFVMTAAKTGTSYNVIVMPSGVIKTTIA